MFALAKETFKWTHYDVEMYYMMTGLNGIRPGSCPVAGCGISGV
jgi:hypothetical protein